MRFTPRQRKWLVMFAARLEPRQPCRRSFGKNLSLLRPPARARPRALRLRKSEPPLIMVNRLNLKLTKHRLGRVLFHLGCLVKGGKIAWHLNGMVRELKPRGWRLKPLILFTVALGLGSGPTVAKAGYYS